jgi:uncharacterized protein
MGVRIIHGRDCLWIIGPGGIARLPASQIPSQGELPPNAVQRLTERGIFSLPANHSYFLTVLMSTECNADCGYCFQNTGQALVGGTPPPRIARARLRTEDLAGILRFADRQMSAANVHNLMLLLFGGEPLLNPRACRELLLRAADHGLESAAIITNAILLTPPIAKDLHRLGLRSVQVTFDGDRADHDRVRTTRGHPTFDRIATNIARVNTEESFEWTIRVNITERNRPGIPNLIKCLADRINPVTATMVFAPVVDTGIGYRAGVSHSKGFAADLGSWQRLALEAGFSVPLPRATSPCLICGYKAGRYGAVVSADGALASCWETAGRPEWVVGNVSEGYVPEPELGRRWTTCATAARYVDDRAAGISFWDRVDAQLLDYMRATGRLHQVPSGGTVKDAAN